MPRRSGGPWDRSVGVRRYRRRRIDEIDLPPTKTEAECCASRRDPDGSLPVGFCSPGCARRPSNLKRLTNQEAP